MTFVNSVKLFINPCTNECRKLVEAAEIGVTIVRGKDKISILGDAAISQWFSRPNDLVKWPDGSEEFMNVVTSFANVLL